MLAEKAFYVQNENGQLAIKKNYNYGYYTQIQMAMGLVHAECCNFVVYTLNGMLVDN